MSQRVVIDPVTRIEGHAKISIFLDDDGQVSDAKFHVVEFRGFEKFCEGRPFGEMPGITARICGICPISHILASAKTGDDIFGVQIPPTAEKLRRMMNLGQITQSHALSFFHLSSPDFLFGWDSDPSQRNILGIAEKFPDVARRGIRLRKFGQELSSRLSGKKIHNGALVPGGVTQPPGVTSSRSPGPAGLTPPDSKGTDVGDNTMDPSTMYDLVGMVAGGLMWSGGLPALVMTAVIVFVGIFALMAIPNAVTHITGQISLASIAPQALRVAGKPLEKASDYSARRMNEVRSGFMHGKTEHHHLRDQARSDAERGHAARMRLGQFIRDS